MVSRLFYPRMAAENLRKNKSFYLPYLLSGVLVVSLYYMLSAIRIMVVESGMKGARSMGTILQASVPICAFMALVILFYANSFVMKRRKREFGLYSILGMEKRHISIVILWEVLYTAVLSLVLGIICGALFSQLMFLLFSKAAHFTVQLTFQIPVGPIWWTFVLFAVIFGLVLIYDIVSVFRSDPIMLLHSDKTGEREPKARWFLAGAGVLFLAGGYGLALSAKSAQEAVGIFFLAVILVVLATYCLFIAGSIALLKLLRKNQRFYYKPSNFISVSGMIYRMKQNAVGLATICILSTAVLVTLSTCFSLFLGEEDILESRFPREVQVTCMDTKNPRPLLDQAAEEHAARYGLSIKNEIGYSMVNFAVVYTEKGLDLFPDGSVDYNYIGLLSCITEAYYEEYTGESISLQEGEAAVYSTYEQPLDDTLLIGDTSFSIAKTLDTIDPSLEYNQMGLENRVIVILSSLEDLEKIVDVYNRNNPDPELFGEKYLQYYYYFDVEGEGDRTAYYDTMREAFNERVDHLSIVDNIDDARQDFYGMYGSLLFVGIFLVLMFMIATVLIIYYKQITEGFDDNKRFHIMKNVGMSNSEIRKTIQKQVLMVFFLPLGMAFLHTAVAFPVLCKVLVAFNLYNTGLFFLCTLATAVVFAVAYFIVYQITAHAYYRIVQS